MKACSIIDAPSDLGLRRTGGRALGGAGARAGNHDRFRSRHLINIMQIKTLALVVATVLGGVGGVGGVPCALWAKDYTPAKCTAALPYEGKPVYGKPVEIPPDMRIGDTAFSPEVVERLAQAMADAMRHTKAAHMSASVATSAGIWSDTRSADGTAQYKRLYWASAGKALTAVVILQLVEEKKLSLTDPVSRWVDGVPHGKLITVDHLLLHTSGLFSANEDLKVRKENRYLTPEESIRISARHGAMFCPGQAWRYSNTGYTVLGKIIEAIEGRPYHEVVNRRIGERLNLATLRALAPQESVPDVADVADIAPLMPADVSQPKISPSWPFAAGAVVGSAEDMLRFWHAVLARKLLSPENTARMFETLYPMFDQGTYYGRGVMLYELPGEDGSMKAWLGHSGGTPGAKAVVVYSPADQAFVSVALSGDGPAEASANLLLKQLANPQTQGAP